MSKLTTTFSVPAAANSNVFQIYISMVPDHLKKSIFPNTINVLFKKISVLPVLSFGTIYLNLYEEISISVKGTMSHLQAQKMKKLNSNCI